MANFLSNIYFWYEQNKRDLPWRKTNDPYKIWLSEIILQQTRVAQGTPYYEQFIKKFPTVQTLANASEDEVLKLWQGLGYYSRARNLHFTARYINSVLNGTFPSDYHTILKLKGIGPYTAAAIASIAFQLPYPTIDGNIYRVFSRYFGIETPINSTKGKKEFEKLARELMPEKNPGMHNQALMEFGALLCTPKLPHCINCPIHESCAAFAMKKVDLLPVKSKKTKQVSRYFNYFYFDEGEFTYIEKRTNNDIWKNMFQFPMFESSKKLNEKELVESEFLQKNAQNSNVLKFYPSKKHILSHQIIYAFLVHIEVKEPHFLNQQFLRVNKKDIFTFAVPKLVEDFLNTISITQ